VVFFPVLVSSLTVVTLALATGADLSAQTVGRDLSPQRPSLAGSLSAQVGVEPSAQVALPSFLIVLVSLTSPLVVVTVVVPVVVS